MCLTLKFFQDFWSYVRKGISQYVGDFFKKGYLDPQINRTMITLVPKADNPKGLQDSRPISLCNVQYKIISKILPSCFRPIMAKIILEKVFHQII